MTIPDILTWLRIIIIPIFIGLFFIPYSGINIILTILFVFAAVTDWLDGYLARKWQQTSAFGAFLDPVADKLIVASAIVLIVYQHPYWYFVLCAIVIINREITISALREWMASMGARGIVAVSWIGKWKTAVQMISITLLLYQQSLFGLPIFFIGTIGLLIATILTLWSMWQYLFAAWRQFSPQATISNNENLSTND